MRICSFLLSLSLCCFLGVFTAEANTAYLDGTGATEGAYKNLWDAVDALPDEGGTIIVSGDTTVGTSSSAIILPEKNGKLTIKGENNAKLTIAYGLKLGSETEIDNIELVNTSSTEGFICAMGHKLIIGDNVTTSRKNTSRWLTIRGGNNVGDETTTYDSHVIVRSGTWRYIFGGSKGTFNGNSTVEVSNVTVDKTLSAVNEAGYGAFHGTALLIVDLRGDRTVTAAKFAEQPVFVTDEGYEAVLDDTTYSQAKAEIDALYVDSTGEKPGAYTTLEEAIAALPNEGGTVIVCDDIVVSKNNTSVTLPEKSGKVTVKGEPGAKLTIAYGVKLGGETEIDDIALVNSSGSMGFICAMGHKLTVGENVTTDRENTDRWLTIYGGNNVSGETTTYDSHVIVRSGTWRYIFGGSKGIFNGNSTVEVSGIMVGTLSGGNEAGSFNGAATLILDLRDGKTVTASKYIQTPTFRTDIGYAAVLNDNTYSQERDTVQGDINGDGKISVADVLLILKAILNDAFTKSTDVNGDGETSLADVLQALKKIGSMPSVPVGESILYTIDELNTDNTPWSHVDDNINTATLEISYRDTVMLGSEALALSSTNEAMYPRIKKVKDDLYLFTYMQGQYGGDALYYTTSKDGKNWAAPSILWQGADTVKGGRFVHTEGPLKGRADSYIGVNPDFCVLQNGDILAVYYLRPRLGSNYSTYEPYQRFSGVHMKRGTIGADGTITWGADQKLTYGRGWEPTVWQRPDGRVEIFWTNASTGILRYEDAHWSSVGMVYSEDNGFTWIPDIESGLENEYLYLNIFQEVTDEHLPTAVYEDGTPWFTEPQPFAKGQMPSVTNLYNGKTLLAVEARPYNGSFHITLATSPAGGDWQHVDFAVDTTESTEAIAGAASPVGAGPYVSTFPSGEVYLVYNQGLMQRGRMVRADGKEIGLHEFSPTPTAYNAFWGCCAVVGSHKALSAIHDTDSNIHIYTSYLNHRINAKQTRMTLDGCTDDWSTNTDALFVGSESQAQATVRVAHDDENVYFLLSLLDYYLTSNDSVTVCVAETEISDRRITVRLDGTATLDTYYGGEKQKTSHFYGAKISVKGTVDDNTDTDEGAVIEIAVPKAKLALENASETAVRLVLNNNDGNGTVIDSFTGVHSIYTIYWPKIILD